MSEGYFDDDNLDLNNLKFWRINTKSQVRIEDLQPDLQDKFYQKQKESQQITRLQLYLQDQILYYVTDYSGSSKNIEENKIKGYQDIYVAKVKWFDDIEPKDEDPQQQQKQPQQQKTKQEEEQKQNQNKAEFWFQLTRNQASCKFYTTNYDVIQRWRLFLNMQALLTNFHEDYEVKKMIGKGTFAKVYLAQKKFNQAQQFAIKAFNKKFMEQQLKGKESLINEIKVMRSLDSDNTIRLYEIYETKNSLYFVLELLKGGELLNKVQQQGNNFKEKDLKNVIKNLMVGLVHLHSKNIMHRDLKPENILLKSPEGYDIVLADFGLATFKPETEFDEQSVIFKRCGTPGFIAPEILHYKEGSKMYDEKCDIFSAGIIFFLLVTGKQPFAGSDLKEILKANKACKINFSQYKINNPDALDLIQVMLSVNPEERPSAKQVLQHPFFQNFDNENYNKEEEESKNTDLENKFLGLQLQQFKDGLQNKVVDSEENLKGSLTLKSNSQSALTGKIDSFSYQQDSNQSIDLQENNNKSNVSKQIKISQFKAFSNQSKESSQDQDSDPSQSPTNNKKQKQQQQQESLHQKVIKNNLKKQLQNDNYQEEGLQIQKVSVQNQKQK